MSGPAGFCARFHKYLDQKDSHVVPSNMIPSLVWPQSAPLGNYALDSVLLCTEPFPFSRSNRAEKVGGMMVVLLSSQGHQKEETLAMFAVHTQCFTNKGSSYS